MAVHDDIDPDPNLRQEPGQQGDVPSVALANADQAEPQQENPSRLHLIWSVLIFQLKLLADGLRDVVLVPISLVAALVGLVAGGNEPARYFNRVLEFGRRTEFWINLFGHRRQHGTADELLEPIKERVFHEAETNPVLKKAGSSVNRSLDAIGTKLQNKEDKTE